MYEQRLPRVTRIITGINLLSFHSLAFQSKQNTPIKEYTIADIYTTLTLGPYVYAIFPEQQKLIGSNTEARDKAIPKPVSYTHLEPFFTIRNGEIHHKVRIDKKINFKVYFYGENITEEDKKIATRFVEANMNNLNTNYPEIYFYNDYKEINI